MNWRRAVIKDTEYSTIGRLIIGQYVHQKLEEEKVRWAKHGIELAEEHIDWAEEYAYSGLDPNHVSFFDYLRAAMN